MNRPHRPSRVALTATFLVTALLSLTAHAHHGLDFMVLQDGTLPKPGSMMFFDNTEWSTFNGEDEWGTEPGIHLGVTPWLAIGTTASIMDEGNGWHYSSTTPYLNLPLFKTDRLPWLKVSLYAGYEFPDNAARPSSAKSANKSTTSLGSRTGGASPSAARNKPSPTPNSTAKPTPPANPHVAHHVTGGGTVDGGGPDAPGGGDGTTHDHPTTSGQSRRSQRTANDLPQDNLPLIAAPIDDTFLGIHRHGEEGLHARLIIDVNLSGHDKLLANLINFTPRQGAPAWGYALGYRHAFYHDLAASLEAIGDLDARGSHEALVAVHYTIDHAFTVKLGVSTGLTESSPDASIHGGIVWRF